MGSSRCTPRCRRTCPDRYWRLGTRSGRKSWSCRRAQGLPSFRGCRLFRRSTLRPYRHELRLFRRSTPRLCRHELQLCRHELRLFRRSTPRLCWHELQLCRHEPHRYRRPLPQRRHRQGSCHRQGLCHRHACLRRRCPRAQLRQLRCRQGSCHSRRLRRPKSAPSNRGTRTRPPSLDRGGALSSAHAQGSCSDRITRSARSGNRAATQVRTVRDRPDRDTVILRVRCPTSRSRGQSAHRPPVPPLNRVGARYRRRRRVARHHLRVALRLEWQEHVVRIDRTLLGQGNSDLERSLPLPARVTSRQTQELVAASKAKSSPISGVNRGPLPQRTSLVTALRPGGIAVQHRLESQAIGEWDSLRAQSRVV